MNKEVNGHGLDGAPLLAKALGIALEVGNEPRVTLDLEKYCSMLGDDLTYDQKLSIVRALVKIVQCFVDLGYGVSLYGAPCGQVAQSEGFCGGAELDMVWSELSTLTDNFNKIAAE